MWPSAVVATDAVARRGDRRQGEPDAPCLRRVTIPPLKGRDRAEQKIAEDYKNDAAQLIDVVRCSVIVEDEAQLIAVADALAECAASSSSSSSDGGGGRDPFVVVRLKNRFAEPLFNGYRDALYSLRIKVCLFVLTSVESSSSLERTRRASISPS